jgi:cytochrome c
VVMNQAGRVQNPARTVAREIKRMRKALGIAVAVAGLLALSGSALAAGDAAKGKEVFAKCAICHQIGPGAKTLIGPELNGIIGRKAASVADFPSYSAGMKKLGDSGWVWTEENIDKWIANPKAMIPDSMMALAFPGLPDATERADVIAYLKTNP